MTHVTAVDAIVTAETTLATRYGPLRAVAFRFPSGAEHIALIHGRPASADHPLLRLQSACLTSSALGAIACDCAAQLDLSLRVISQDDAGLLLHLHQEGMGHGLVGKIAQMAQASSGSDVLAELLATGQVDLRRYDEAAHMVRVLVGDRPVRLMTNNPEKVARATAAGINTFDRIPIEVEPDDNLIPYLRMKKERLGHLLTKV